MTRQGSSMRGELGSRVETAGDVVVNGRYEQLEAGGYRRFAREISSNLDATIVCPPPTWSRGVRGRLWEQTILPRLARDRVLLSPANSGPLTHPRQVLIVHDTLALQHPHWYGRRAVQLQRATLPPLVRRASAVVTPSLKVADDLIGGLDVDADRVHVVPPAVGPPFGPEPHAISEGLTAKLADVGINLDDGQPLVFGLISSNRRKNSDHLLHVLSSVREGRPEVMTVVAGHAEPPRVVAGGDRPSRSGVADVGPLCDDDLAELFRRADVFVSLSRGEGFGMPVLEAAVSGAAVVTTEVPAALEVVAPAFGSRCALVGPDDVIGAVHAVERMLRTPRANIEGLREFAGAHQWSQRADAIAQILDHVSNSESVVIK